MKALKPFLPLLIFTFLILILVTMSYITDDNKAERFTYNEGNSLTTYMALSGFYEKAEVTNNVPVFSKPRFRFKPSTTGNINSFSVSIPDINPALRVALWDTTLKFQQTE
ncbi:hypothetical protein CLU81_2976 [Flavobacterium sp. 9]|uniref:hypothetical protein n=1 Tax=Flavobacterium sp. 9 TaxID=2035198 RepID=UPI000C4ACF42|nr:hypothetical protein [Flavobacterium sp. 9]PIF32447.1 hypothetical protein CLU81_2976 [Flavobacterium sp. 9]